MENTIFKSCMNLILVGSLVVGCSALTSCYSTYQRESAGQYLDNSVITAKVKSKLLADRYVSGLPITVKTYKNIVQLSGFVNTKFQENRAVKIARSIKDVEEVKDALVVKSR